MKFFEITISNGKDEIMLNISEENKLIGMYTDSDSDVIVTYMNDFGYEYEVNVTKNWKVGKNPLFKHAKSFKSFKQAIKALNNSMEFVAILEEEDKYFEKEVKSLYEVLENFGLENNLYYPQ